MSPVNSIRDKAKTRFDLTRPEDQQSLYKLCDELSALGNEHLDAIREADQPDAPLEYRLAVKLLESRHYLSGIKRPLKIGIVYAMWGEHNRLYPRTDSNPHGEDSLRTKITQLEWATRNTPVDWVLYPVDDGCPHNSGGIAEEIAATSDAAQQVSVQFLEQALPAADGPLRNLASANDSRKAGAIILGCMKALEDQVDAVIYTDADNSVHMGQIGLLLRPFLEDQARVVLGNRKHPDAVLVKQEARWGVGIKTLRHMQRMVGQAIFSRNILDTQAAFKLYDREFLEQIIQNPTVYDFSFDTDWILAAIASDEPISQTPFAFIDSFAESASITQGPMTTWETLLLGLVKAVRKHGVAHSEAMARVLDEEIHSAADLDVLLDALPPQLEAAAAEDLGDPAIMTAEAMQSWIRDCKLRHQAA